MLDASSFSAIDNDIIEAERLLNERVQVLIAHLKKGGDTIEDEARIRDIRQGLELLYNQRQRLARSTHVTASVGPPQFSAPLPGFVT
jgi:hypothetical protein